MLEAAQSAYSLVFFSTILTNLITIGTRHEYHKDTFYGWLQLLPPASILGSHYNLSMTLAQQPQQPQ